MTIRLKILWTGEVSLEPTTTPQELFNRAPVNGPWQFFRNFDTSYPNETKIPVALACFESDNSESSLLLTDWMSEAMASEQRWKNHGTFLSLLATITQHQDALKEILRSHNRIIALGTIAQNRHSSAYPDEFAYLTRSEGEATAVELARSGRTFTLRRDVFLLTERTCG